MFNKQQTSWRRGQERRGGKEGRKEGYINILWQEDESNLKRSSKERCGPTPAHTPSLFGVTIWQWCWQMVQMPLASWNLWNVLGSWSSLVQLSTYRSSNSHNRQTHTHICIHKLWKHLCVVCDASVPWWSVVIKTTFLTYIFCDLAAQFQGTASIQLKRVLYFLRVRVSLE